MGPDGSYWHRISIYDLTVYCGVSLMKAYVILLPLDKSSEFNTVEGKAFLNEDKAGEYCQTKSADPDHYPDPRQDYAYMEVELI